MSRPGPLVVYADYVCPFCYLGKASLETYLDSAADPPTVEWHPFDLRASKRGPDGEIDSAVDDGKDDAYFEGVRENVERLRDRYDVEMTRDVAREVDSWDAQKLALSLREAGDADALASFHDAVFDALWRDDRDVGDVDVLVDLGGDVGVPEADVRTVLAAEDLDDELRAQFDAARRAGVTGVPTFVYGQHAARGAVPPAQIERLIEG